ncbi:hypothetical protein EBM76_23235 [Vibrio parahaemolyticus]|nr:hypothetical protein [Vibrio parahaemolyticus]
MLQRLTLQFLLDHQLTSYSKISPHIANAALSGEQRRPPHLNHCAVNTKAESNRKCRALGIRLKRFVMHIFKV